MKKYPNLIRGFNFKKPNQLWVSDITYIPVEGSYAYLSLVTDACSRKILGYYLSRNLAAEGAVMALKWLYLTQKPSCSDLFITLIVASNIVARSTLNY